MQRHPPWDSAARGPGYGVGAPLPEPVSAAMHRADAIGLRSRSVRLPGCDRADLWCLDVVWRRVVAASVVGAAPDPGVAVGQCEAGDQRSADHGPTQRTCGINAISCLASSFQDFLY